MFLRKPKNFQTFDLAILPGCSFLGSPCVIQEVLDKAFGDFDMGRFAPAVLCQIISAQILCLLDETSTFVVHNSSNTQLESRKTLTCLMHA